MNQQASPGVAEAQAAREQLYDTLSQLRGRLDYAQRVDDALDRTKHRIAADKRENPIAFTAGVIAVAGVVGLAVWGVARKVAQAFE